MAKKHKAPTQVTLVQEEKGAFATWIHSNWKMLTVATLAVSGLILGSQFKAQQSRANQDEKFDSLRGAVLSVDPGQIEGVATDLSGSSLDGWANLMALELAVVDGRYDDAENKVAALEATAPTLLTQLSLPIGPDGESRTVLEHVKAALASQAAQERELGLQLTNPEPPPGSPVVRFVTDQGDVEITLYQEAAPLHVANFLNLVKKGDYDGTRFHRTIKGFMIQGGDPQTKNADSDPGTWGQGGTEVPKVDSEADNGLVHAPFVLAGAKMGGDTQSSGTQFYITVGHTHHLDGLHTVYGKVTKGEDVVRKLAGVPVQLIGQPGQQEYSWPLEAPLLIRAEVISGD
jgi:peptidyl-prolyl cis-trans isomerase A (cyclophilin A)